MKIQQALSETFAEFAHKFSSAKMVSRESFYLSSVSTVFIISRQSLEIEEMVNRIARHKGVIGVMVFNNDGVAIKSNLDETQTILWAGLVGQVIKSAGAVGSSFEEGVNFTMLRVRTERHEVLISPEEDHVMVSIHQQVNENWIENCDGVSLVCLNKLFEMWTSQINSLRFITS